MQRPTLRLLALALGLAACSSSVPSRKDISGADLELPTMHRLTRSQYIASVRDILGVEVPADTQLEPDMAVNGLVSVGAGMTTISPLGVEQYEAAAFHSLTHDPSGAAQDQVHQITSFIMTKLGEMLAVLKDVPEGAGNLLDNCSILATSDLADGYAHNYNNYPIIIAGGGGGTFRRPGTHYRSTSGENSSTALLTVLRGAGLQLSEFGRAESFVNGGVSAIEV